MANFSLYLSLTFAFLFVFVLPGSIFKFARQCNNYIVVVCSAIVMNNFDKKLISVDVSNAYLEIRFIKNLERNDREIWSLCITPMEPSPQ